MRTRLEYYTLLQFCSLNVDILKIRRRTYFPFYLAALRVAHHSLYTPNLLPTPMLMYGSDLGTWFLNVSLLLKLESFQTEIGKRILKLPRFTANNVPLMAVAIGWHSMRCRCLSTPYYRVSSRNVDTLSSEVYRTLSMPNVESISCWSNVIS